MKPGPAGALLLASSLLWGCGGSASTGGEGGAPAQAVARVTTTRVTRGPIAKQETFAASVAAPPNRDVRISAQVPGRIAELHAAEGDRVASGQLLAKLDDGPYRDQLRQADAGVAQAEANFANAKLALARNEDLFQRGITARKDLENARTQQSLAEASLNQVRAASSLARLQVARTEIRSPLSGTVVKRFASVGEQVDGTAAQPIAEVADTREVEMHAQIAAADLSTFHAGQPVSLSTDAFPGKTLHGQVVAVASAIDPATNLGLVRIRIPNADGALRLGMFLSVQMSGEVHANALVVPSQAVYRDEQGIAIVYRVERKTATSVSVKTGIEGGGKMELLSGVREGDAIILTGGYGLGSTSEVSVDAPGGKP